MSSSHVMGFLSTLQHKKTPDIYTTYHNSPCDCTVGTAFDLCLTPHLWPWAEWSSGPGQSRYWPHRYSSPSVSPWPPSPSEWSSSPHSSGGGRCCPWSPARPSSRCSGRSPGGRSWLYRCTRRRLLCPPPGTPCPPCSPSVQSDLLYWSYLVMKRGPFLYLWYLF